MTVADAPAVITLCRTCLDADPAMVARVGAAVQSAGLAAQVQQVDCMSGCARGPTLAVRAPGKTAYLFGEFAAADLPDLVTFLRLYQSSDNGDLADARPLGGLRFKALARIPGPRGSWA